jgi:hypothetical protein
MTSESLRTDECVGQVEEQEQRDHPTNQVGDHNRSNPRRTTASSKKPPIVSNM